jgi:hypothetical protein
VYNPSQESIKVAALNSLLTTAREKLKAADVSRTAYENAINARQPVFRLIPKLASRIVDALQVGGVPRDVIEDAMAIKRRFNGPAKKLVSSSHQTTLPDGTVRVEEIYQRRISQLDLASKVENFEKLLNRVSAAPLYQPNEADLKLEALQTFLENLKAMNGKVVSTFMTMKNDMRELNTVLSEGIYERTKTVKVYIRSLFGRGSAEYKEISSFKISK